MASWKGKDTGNHGFPNQILGFLGNVALSKRFLTKQQHMQQHMAQKCQRSFWMRSTQLESQSTRNKSCPLILKMEVQAYVMSLVTWGPTHLPDTLSGLSSIIITSPLKVPVLRYTTVYPTLRHNDITWHNHIILMKLLPINSMLLKSPAKTNNISIPPTNQQALVSWYNLQTFIWGSKIGRSGPYMSI